MSKIKISKPERLPRDGISDIDFQTWKNELLNYLQQDNDFERFTARGEYSSWLAAEVDDRRIPAIKGDDNAEDLPNRRRQLNNYLTIIAGCCYKDSYMTVIQQATSLEWIWQELKNVYQITHRGKDFLSIVDIKWDSSTMSATSVYNAYRAKIIENLKPKDTVVKWKNTTMQTNETLSPTFEDHILMSVLQLIDHRLPAKVREIYGPRMENEKFLMDFKSDILANTTKMLEDMDGVDVQVNALNQQFNRTRFNNRRQPNRQQFNRRQFDTNQLFCRLCHTSRRPRNIVTSHEIGDLSCPSLSERDKAALKNKGVATAALVPRQLTEEEELAELAKQHGYDDDLIPDEATEQVQVENINTCPTNFIAPVPSQILTLYQNDKIVHLDLDSGSWVSCVKYDYAKQMGWKIFPNDQLAKLADNQTVLKSVGEIHEVLTRNNWSVNFHALVLPNLHTNVIGGNNFMKENKVEQKINSHNIVIQGKFVVPETNRNVSLPTHINNIIVPAQLNKVILPKQSIKVPVPMQDNTVITVEPRMNNKLRDWPIPQICTVTDGTIELTNDSEEPLRPGKAPHQLQIRQSETKDKQEPTPGYQYKKNPVNNTPCLEEIKINHSIMTPSQAKKLHQLIDENKEVFNKDLSKGYNHFSGKHFCRLNWSGSQRPSSRKVICPSYNSQLNTLLQEVCDELTDNNVLGIPQDDDITVQCISPCFLRRKQRAKDKPVAELTKNDVRLVVNTNVVSQHLKNIPSKVTKPQEVYAALSKWKYVIKTDLYQGFFQNHLHPDAYQWCAIQTPFGGMRYFKRSIQGLVGQTEEQDENLAKVLHHLLKQGHCIKIADDIFAGGTDIEEAINNFGLLITTLNKNNLKISPSKTVLFPSQVDILSWVWNEGGYLSPSPHRKQALADMTTESITTVRDLRSWLGLYKTFIDCTPNLTALLDPFDAIVGGKDSKDTITWTAELQNHFNKAQQNIKNMTNLYLPTSDDQLIITCDGARTPPAVGMVLQAKTPDQKIKIVRYYSVKLKNHHLKWFPCELEATALGTAIEAFYEFIKQSNKPVIICPDSKAVVDAAKKLSKGQFSLSPRIQTFLNNLGKINHDIQHISGKSGHNAAGDFQSRTASDCNSELCQICNYVTSTADTIIDVKLNPITDAQESAMPFLNRITWKHIQDRDKACSQAKHCLTTGQTASKKSGKTNVETRRIIDKAHIASDGLLVVDHTIPLSTTKIERIVVPTTYLDSLMSQIHASFNHPAKSQFAQIFSKYFFAHNSTAAIDNLYEACQVCKASQNLPKQLYQYKTETNAKQPGTHFNIDVLKRAKQKIMVCTDQFSTFTTATFIENETAEHLKSGIIKTTQAIKHPGKITIRVDSAAGFKSLHQSNSLGDLNIELELGEPLNKNSNACVDKSISELNQEIKKLVFNEKPINDAILSKALTNLNNKLRRNGQLSASNILFSRDRMANKNLQLDDAQLAHEQLQTRSKNNQQTSKSKNSQQPSKPQLSKGDIVMTTANPAKHNIRESFVVTDDKGDKITIQKILHPHDNQRRRINNIKYKIRPDRLIKASSTKLPAQHQTSQTYPSTWTPFRKTDTSDSEDSDDDLQRQQQLVQPILHQPHVTIRPPTPTMTAQRNSTEEENEEFLSAEQSPVQGARPKIKESWSLKERSSSRKAARNCNKRLKELKDKGTFISQQTEVKRDDSHQRSFLISPLDAERDFSSAENSLEYLHDDSETEQPSLDWDDHDETTSPTFLNDQAFLRTPETYPERVSPGRVYNFDNLPPLPVNVTSPPSAQALPVSSTPKTRKPKSKPRQKSKTRMFQGLKKLF